jgi:hypothetical protein
VRLAGGRIPNEGRVELYHNGIWGIICADQWDMKDGAVACRSTGFPAPTSVFEHNRPFTPVARKKQLLFDLQCKGYETSLWKCPNSLRRSRGDHYCSSKSYAASVICGRPAGKEW